MGKLISQFERGPKCSLHNKWGNWIVRIYRHRLYPWIEHLAIVSTKTKIEDNESVLIRIHSSCLFGDTLFDKACDCRSQLEKALKEIGQKGGILFYLFQEGRNIGLWNKIGAYALKERGFDTVEANEYLGLPSDNRDYKVVGEILRDMGIMSVALLTNNPDKVAAIKVEGIKVKQILCQGKKNKFNKNYIYTKKNKLKHRIDEKE